ncbi:MAG TPA: hypothetical protein VFU26_04085 [Gaiellaceae bacterium]|nr:hypothetical protein [Gaiellaceae bacterium]
MAEEFRFRLIDTAGSELEIVPHDAATITEGETISMSDGRSVEVIEVYDDEYGRDGDVEATLVVDVD